MQQRAPFKLLCVSLGRCIAILLPLFFCASALCQEQDENLKNDFYLERTYPSGRIPANALSEARKQLAKQKTATPASLPTPSWSLIGPQPTTPRNLTYRGSPVVAGRVTAIAVDPANSKHVYLGGAVGGVWETTDGGSTWTPLTDNQVTLSIGSIAIDPTNTQIIYVGTGEQDYLNSYYGAGILRSKDGGATWMQLGQADFVGPFSAGAGGAYIGSLAVDTKTGYLFAGVLSTGPLGSGIYQSTDGGSTWTVSLSGAAGNAVLYDTNSGYLYAALGPCGSVCGGSGTLQAGVFVSKDDGTTWTSLNNPTLSTTDVGRIGLALFPSTATSQAILYAGIAYATGASAGSLQGVWKSTDAGTTWTLLTASTLTDYCTPQCWFDNVIAVSPTNSNIVFAAGKVPVYQSLDGGSTWTDVSTTANGVSVHSDTHALTFSADGSLLYIGDDGGTWVGSTPGTTGVNWTSLNSRLALTQFYKGLSISPTSVSTTIGGTQDNGTQLYSGSLTWEQVICGDGGATAINPSQPDDIFAECVSNAGTSIYESTTGGGVGTFTQVFTTTDRSFFGETLVIDPSNPQVMYFGSYRVYQSTDGGQTWSLISGDLTNGGYVSALGVAPGSNASSGSTSQVVYATTSDGNVWVTTNAAAGTAAVWNKVTSGLPNRWVSEVFPTSATTAYLTYSGFKYSSDTLGHVFMTTNKGQSWTDVSGNLPNVPVNDIAVDPQSPNMIYIATDVGILGSTDGGATWTTLGSGLPNVAAVGLRIHAASRILRTATHGRSMWDLQLQDFGVSLNPTSATVTAGQPASSVITLTPNSSGFGTAITLSCSGLPTGASCQFNNNPVTPGSSVVTVNVSIPTVAAKSAFRAADGRPSAQSARREKAETDVASLGSHRRVARYPQVAFAIVLPFTLICLGFLDDLSKRKIPPHFIGVLLAFCVVGLIFQMACGGSSPSPSLNQGPVFTSANSTTFTVGTAGSFNVTTTGTPTPTVTETGNLPAGVTFTANASGGGVLAGTPTSAGTFPIGLQATNSAGTANQNFTLTTSTSSNSYSIVITGTSAGVQRSATFQLSLQ